MTVMGFREGTPAGDILTFIQRNGSATVKELEDVLGVSTTAVREQLTHLTNQVLITTNKIRQGPGRPLYRYILLPLLLILTFPFLNFLFGRVFEGRRWAKSDYAPSG